jgi:hypothetical protein
MVRSQRLIITTLPLAGTLTANNRRHRASLPAANKSGSARAHSQTLGTQSRRANGSSHRCAMRELSAASPKNECADYLPPSARASSPPKLSKRAATMVGHYTYAHQFKRGPYHRTGRAIFSRNKFHQPKNNQRIYRNGPRPARDPSTKLARGSPNVTRAK